MAVITFWSNTNKQTGQTMSVAAVAAMMAIEHNYKILLISTQFNDESLELCFGKQDKNKNLVNKLLGSSNTGIDNGVGGLYRVAASGKITPEVIQNYTHVVYNNRLETLYGYKSDGSLLNEDYSKIKEVYKDIIQNANRYYDMVLIDLNKTLEDEKIKEILKRSDVVVYNIEQKMEMINKFTEFKDNTDLHKKDNVILNIGSFDEESKYTLKNISRYLNIRKYITAVPYNTLFFEAADEEKVADLFLKIRNVSQTDKNASFINTVKETQEKIIYKVQELQMRM